MSASNRDWILFGDAAPERRVRRSFGTSHREGTSTRDVRKQSFASRERHGGLMNGQGFTGSASFRVQAKPTIKTLCSGKPSKSAKQSSRLLGR